jgi:predicted nucleotidyltransferase
MPVFRSALQGDILAAILLHPADEVTLSTLAARAGAPMSNVHREVERLVTAGIVSERTLGRSRLLRANVSNPAVRPLTDLVALTFGPLEVVRDEFGDVEGVERLVIFGSWAARYLGEPGPPPRDVDVLVVGKPRRQDVYAAADRAERRLGVPVQPIVRGVATFDADDDPLLHQIKSAPYVAVVGDE